MFIFNSLTAKLELFKPLSQKEVTLYVCGITPYDTTHLGHAFTYISFDVLVRFLRFRGYRVIYTQNVTDINDRDNDILKRAKEQKTTWQKLSHTWTKRFLSDMKNLNWTEPTNFLYASGQIKPMISLIEKIIKNGIGYVAGSGVYLDITKDPEFGILSKLSSAEMIAKAKESEEDLGSPNKRHPLDITLWRMATPDQPKHIPSFDSPWGKGRPASGRGSPGGRPGWHIECSAMAISSLGEQIDIHGGGKDLIYPHHESEIAQSEAATGKVPFVKYWLHSGIVSYQGEKMSKSKGNLVMVADLLKKYSANALRFLLLSHHYREDWEYFEKDIIEAQKKVSFIESAMKNSLPAKENQSSNFQDSFIEVMENDLDTRKALDFLYSLAKKGQTQALKKLYYILGFKP